MNVSQVCARGSIVSIDRGTSPDLILPPFFPKLNEEDGDPWLETVVEEPEKQVIEEPGFPPYFFEDCVERDPPTVYCSALLHTCDEGVPMLW